MNPYSALVTAYANGLEDGRSYPLGGFSAIEHPPLSGNAPQVLVFSPHPDDECIVGALPLRLRHRSSWKVINVAVTQGSNKARQAERLAELQGACAYLGFDLVQTAPNGFERVHLRSREHDAAHWNSMVVWVARLLESTQPRAIFFPHEHDWNETHVGVHWLVMDALAHVGGRVSTTLVETEYWGPMRTPNVMVEVGEATLTEQITATSFHVGEVRRNPYHLLLPAWMQDNVRRGSELIAGKGSSAQDFKFATLYRLRAWRGGAVVDGDRTHCFLRQADDPASLFA